MLHGRIFDWIFSATMRFDRFRAPVSSTSVPRGKVKSTGAKPVKGCCDILFATAAKLETNHILIRGAFKFYWSSFLCYYVYLNAMFAKVLWQMRRANKSVLLSFLSSPWAFIHTRETFFFDDFRKRDARATLKDDLFNRLQKLDFIITQKTFPCDISLWCSSIFCLLLREFLIVIRFRGFLGVILFKRSPNF